MSLPLATVRDHIANYVNVLAYVYTLVIILYILSSLLFAVGLRIPYNRWSDAVLTFLRDVCEPYLRVIRRVLPTFGGIDLSPIVAIVLLRLAGSLIASAIRG